MPHDPPDSAAPPRRSGLDPRLVLAWSRRLILFACLVGALYFWRRFDTFVLSTACSPVVQVSPGTRLWIDRQPPRYHIGDLVFFRGPEGRVHFALVRELRAGGALLWLETDDPRCPGLDSRQLGAIPAADLRGRVVFASSSW